MHIYTDTAWINSPRQRVYRVATKASPDVLVVVKRKRPAGLGKVAKAKQRAQREAMAGRN